MSILTNSCSQMSHDNKTNDNANNMQLFELVNANKSGVDFINTVTESDQFNYMNYEYMYNGGGCAVLDVNNDGLHDLFFVSNQGPDKLYLNKGKLKFDDISKTSGIEGGNEWNTAVNIVDINADGWDDIYVCCSLKPENKLRKNKLYINNKNNTFTESADKFGLADSGYSSQACFFDYDLDKDLDAFIVNQPGNLNEIMDSKGQSLKQFHSGVMYENQGGKFVDITSQSGIINTGFSLSAMVGDVNQDGYPDIYIANDYNIPDEFFINNKNKTFTNVIKSALRHIPQFSMGTDIADINNDGWLDIYTVDMVAEDHYRNKANMSGMNPKAFWDLIDKGYQYQYMFNSLQLNHGNGLFSDISLLAGISNTDWSWSPLLCDMDNDGWKDIYVSNGYLRDVRNKDFAKIKIDYLENKNNPNYKGKKYEHAVDLLNEAPSVKIQNYAYKNLGNLQFEHINKKWGMNEVSFSNGAIYADLDNDGDLEIIVNNINDQAFIYENKSSHNNYLRAHLIGDVPNTKSYGARAVIYTDNMMQISEINPNRGYMSSCESEIHFGLGQNSKVDSIVIRWPSGKTIRKINPKINCSMTFNEKDYALITQQIPHHVNQSLLTIEKETDELKKIYHQENKFDDYKNEVLMPHKMSTLGPCLAIGDVNGDKLEDFYLGGSAGFAGQLFLQQADENFIASSSAPWTAHKSMEDGDALFYDMEDDGDLDLIVVSGSNEFSENSTQYQSRLYLNDGKGNFSDKTNLLPKINISAGVVKAFDLNGDQKKDLFIGGRQIPGKYGVSAPSALLIYENGRYVDHTNKLCSEMTKEFGNVTCASYADLDNDNDLDLIVAGEWMNIKVLENNGKGQLKDQSIKWGTSELTGWWNAILITYVDGDKNVDIVVGNLGTNSKFKASTEKPFMVFLNDFDHNKTWDTYLGSYDPSGKLFPVRGRQCSSEQMPFIKEKFKNYNEFANASLEEVLGEKLDNKTIIKKVSEFHSGVLLNKTGSKFEFHAFPNEAQIAPINDIAIHDFNKDGLADIIYAGNYYNREVETTRSDAGVGGILINMGSGTFKPVHSMNTGLYLYGDVRKLKLIKTAHWIKIITANNNAKIQINEIIK